MRCDGCGAQTDNGLALCQLCRAGLLTDLEFIPVYFRNLSRWRPSRAGSRPVPGSRVLWDGTSKGGDRIGRAIDEAHAELTGWMRSLAEDRPQLASVIARILRMDEEPCVRLMCALLTKRVDTLATLPTLGALLATVAEVEQRLRQETERAVPGWYAGACRLCTTATYVVPGLTWVTCGGCGATTYARDHLDVILEEARGWVATPREIATALVALLETETNVDRLWERIRRWGRPESVVRSKRTGSVQRVIPAGPLHASSVRRRDADGDEVGQRRYRLGDVLDQLQRETRTLRRAG